MLWKLSRYDSSQLFQPVPAAHARPANPLVRPHQSGIAQQLLPSDRTVRGLAAPVRSVHKGRRARPRLAPSRRRARPRLAPSRGRVQSVERRMRADGEDSGLSRAAIAAVITVVQVV